MRVLTIREYAGHRRVEACSVLKRGKWAALVCTITVFIGSIILRYEATTNKN